MNKYTSQLHIHAMLLLHTCIAHQLVVSLLVHASFVHVLVRLIDLNVSHLNLRAHLILCSLISQHLGLHNLVFGSLKILGTPSFSVAANYSTLNNELVGVG